MCYFSRFWSISHFSSFLIPTACTKSFSFMLKNLSITFYTSFIFIAPQKFSSFFKENFIFFTHFFIYKHLKIYYKFL
nr:MAG TPA: hypothetical protein [Bacteriophage sp.]